MKTSIIYHSYSGNTRSVVENVHAACGGDLVEVKLTRDYSRITAYTLGCYRAMKGLCDPIEQKAIDVAAADVIVIGTPVWAGKATPAINTAVAALEGCRGKNAVIFATCGKDGGETLPIIKNALETKGAKVTGEFVFDRAGLKDPDRINAMISAIKTSGRTP
ncbi:MAG: ArsR family transcriptional regulator [Methanoregulaceae archaeon]|nr:MAG: ArsR family transcriptional regulator [Methanoregulaceae archaeon]